MDPAAGSIRDPVTVFDRDMDLFIEKIVCFLCGA
jgi:hypothetical protein